MPLDGTPPLQYSADWKYAFGIRNTVGFDWHPTTDKLYFTDNGADWMGDDIPPDEFNVVSEPFQEHFGFPWCCKMMMLSRFVALFV